MLDFVSSLFTGIWPHLLALFAAGGVLMTFIARVRRSARDEERLSQALRNEKERHANDYLIEEARRARAAAEAAARDRLRSVDSSDRNSDPDSLSVGPNPHSRP